MRLLLATKNTKKVREIQAILQAVPGLEVISAADFAHIDEPEETGETFLENARLKAHYYSRHSGLLSLADDSGLAVDALDGRPGVHSSRYGANDEDRIARLLLELADVPDGKRTARFHCVMVLASPEQEVAVSEGTLEGRISRVQRGSGGFGYDPVFEVAELGLHLAEVPAEQKNAVSHRGLALRKMLPVLGAGTY